MYSLWLFKHFDTIHLTESTGLDRERPSKKYIGSAVDGSNYISLEYRNLSEHGARLRMELGHWCFLMMRLLVEAAG